MVFSSVLFLFIYLPIVLAVYYLVPARFRNIWLFAVNLVFYGWGEPVYILLMLFSITLNYVSGICISNKKSLGNNRAAKTVLAVNTAVNLLILVIFKYLDLILQTIGSVLGVSISPLGLSLPIGISFYTFQTMSYPIDIYRGDTEVQKNYISFGTFVALFPQLIAGPIVRYKDIALQLSDRQPNIDQFSSGVERFTIGLGKKVLLANNLGLLWDCYCAQPNPSFIGAWLGAIAFSLQIYFDFSGYSDMAIGLGRMLGFEFMENFNYPYISKSITEFWRRWHVSLGTWFRDYLYIPLGGNRRGLPRQLLNILIVWALTGLWHGANWTFLVWGLYYALFLVLEKTVLLKSLNKLKVFNHIYSLLITVFGWIVFQLDSLDEVFCYWKSMLYLGNCTFVKAYDIFQLKSHLFILIISVIAATPFLKTVYKKMPVTVQRILAPILIALILVLSTSYLVDATYNPFLYFRF